MITKSDYLKYLQCYKYLWLHKFRKDLIPSEVSLSQQHIFDEGYEVEAYALKLFPGAVLASEDFKQGPIETKRLMQSLEPVIFQPTVSTAGLFIRADIIEWDSKAKAWNIYEVKGTTSVKDIHIVDVAFQKLTFEKAGYPINKMYLIHVNNKFVKKGEIDPKKLLTVADITDQVNEAIHNADIDIEGAKKVLDIKDEPDVPILKQCKKPYDCVFIDHCWKNVPDNSIYTINRGFSEKQLKELISLGIDKIVDVPMEMLTADMKLKQYEALTTGKPIIDLEAIKADLDTLEYPIYFLDYETFATATPIVEGTKPYQQVVFQHSLHVQETPDSELKHYEYLATSSENPSYEIAKHLSEIIGSTGSVIAWNMSFEKGRNKEMAKMNPEFATILLSINDRMFDLMEIFRKGYYVHKDFKGSASIKKVLPVLVPELSHKNLAIQEGGTASLSWLTLIDQSVDEKERKQLEEDMLKYCELDTFAMVEILRVLQEL
jgi:hypothetical protein